MKTNFKYMTIADIINFCCFLVSIILSVVGFCLPPIGVIDNSVLVAIGELGFICTVTKIPDFIKALKNGASIEIEKGDSKIKIEGAENNN